MLFSSYEFLLVYLPVVMAGFWLMRRWGHDAGLIWLLLASLIFYAVWNLRDLGVLAASVAGNFLLARTIIRSPRPSRRSFGLLTAGVAANLSVLIYFKYVGFFSETVATILGQNWQGSALILPLAISFYTFQQIAFLVDVYRDETDRCRFRDYALFVVFFPQLIAGPIVHHREMLQQFRDPHRLRLAWSTTAVGLAYFVAGLAKKVLIADSLAPTADAVFSAAQTAVLTPTEAWGGTLAYTLQLYFDFSGYSDMAIGLGWLFGMRLPTNFNAPYRAVHIGDFWRRWHITLSRFLRDYLYIPLGGNRCGPWRQAGNLGLTMLLGGLWHGAGWTFLAWGAMHGAYLAMQHAWTRQADQRGWMWRRTTSWRITARCGTLLAVMLGWIVFRAEDLTTAGRMFQSLAGAGGAAPSIPLESVWTLCGLLAFVQFAPTTSELIPDPRMSTPVVRPSALGNWIAFRATAFQGAILGATFLVCITLLTRVKEFLYFQF